VLLYADLAHLPVFVLLYADPAHLPVFVLLYADPAHLPVFVLLYADLARLPVFVLLYYVVPARLPVSVLHVCFDSPDLVGLVGLVSFRPVLLPVSARMYSDVLVLLMVFGH
jgi:hypothetical protein